MTTLATLLTLIATTTVLLMTARDFWFSEAATYAASGWCLVFGILWILGVLS